MGNEEEIRPSVEVEERATRIALVTSIRSRTREGEEAQRNVRGRDQLMEVEQIIAAARFAFAAG